MALLACLARLLPAGSSTTSAASRRRKTALARLTPALDIPTREYAGDIDFSRLCAACGAEPRRASGACSRPCLQNLPRTT